MRMMGIDMGTSGCKAVVFDENWRVVCRAYREYSLYFPGEGLLELDADAVWRGICEVVREANGRTDEPVKALAVSAIGDVIIPMDDDGGCTRRAIVDFDLRGQAEIRRFSKDFGVKKFFDISGMPPLYIGSLAKMLWIKDHEPEVFGRTSRWATFEDFIISRLGLGTYASWSEISRTMLFDIRKREWAEPIMEKLPVTRDMLPKGLPSGAVIGELPKAVCDELGFRHGVKAVAGGHDMVCAAIGAGLDEGEPTTAVDIAGTIEGLVAAMRSANTCDAMLENLLPCYIGASGYVTFSVNLTAGCIVRWYRDMIAPDEYAVCKKNNIDFYKYMQRTMNPAEPGALYVIPHFSGSGNPFFNASAKGAVYGLTLDTRRSDIARAVIEGLSYELLMHLGAFKKAGLAIDTLRAVGGGAAIDEQLQLKANITGLRVIKGAVTESSALGAAAQAAVALGAIADPSDAYRAVKGEEKEFLPDRAAHEKFLEAYEKYEKLACAVDLLDGAQQQY